MSWFAIACGGPISSAGEGVEGLLEAALGDEIVEGGVFHDAALVDDDDAVTHGFYFLQDVRREDDGTGLPKGLDEGADVLDLQWVEA